VGWCAALEDLGAGGPRHMHQHHQVRGLTMSTNSTLEAGAGLYPTSNPTPDLDRKLSLNPQTLNRILVLIHWQVVWVLATIWTRRFDTCHAICGQVSATTK